MLKKILFTFTILLLNSFFVFSQVSNFKEKFNLPEEVKETSGLLFLNGKIITHNDSGDNANLYEIDSLSGNLERTISISNATNVDWEDISENDTHIFIADIGNNNGNRTDLKIYKISKPDYLNNTSVSAEIISFSYEDQTDFSSQPNSSNFDAEGIVVYRNNLLIFTKNWADFKTNVYKIPTTAGNYTAVKISSADVEGLITGATYNLEDDSFFLCGYNTSLIPFLIYMSENRMPGDDIFFSGFNKFSLENELGLGSQVEGITNIDNTSKYYLSRENFTTTQGGIQFNFPQKLYEFNDEANPLLSIEKNEFTNFSIQPNPVIDKINIVSNSIIHKIEVFNALGKRVILPKINSQKEIDISVLSSGIYYLKLQSNKNKIAFKKIIKL